jgi:hypothetical protein
VVVVNTIVLRLHVNAKGPWALRTVWDKGRSFLVSPSMTFQSRRQQTLLALQNTFGKIFRCSGNQRSGRTLAAFQLSIHRVQPALELFKYVIMAKV